MAGLATGVTAMRGGLIVIVDGPFLSAALLAGYLFQINTKFARKAAVSLHWPRTGTR